MLLQEYYYDVRGLRIATSNGEGFSGAGGPNDIDGQTCYYGPTGGGGNGGPGNSLEEYEVVDGFTSPKTEYFVSCFNSCPCGTGCPDNFPVMQYPGESGNTPFIPIYGPRGEAQALVDDHRLVERAE